MTNCDYAYFMRRAAEERGAADVADHPDVQRAHLELAQRYELAAAALAEAPVLQTRSGRRAV